MLAPITQTLVSPRPESSPPQLVFLIGDCELSLFANFHGLILQIVGFVAVPYLTTNPKVYRLGALLKTVYFIKAVFTDVIISQI